jgi:hypothetical protein
MASNNNIYKMSNAGGFKSLTRYYDMLAGNTVWNPWSPAGAYESIATATVGSSGAATITFSGIPSTYTHLQLRGIGRSDATNQIQQMVTRFNGDSSAAYAAHYLVGDGSSASAGADTSITGINMERLTYSTQTSGVFSAFVIDILDYANTNKYKTTRTLAGYDNNGGGTYPGRVILESGLWQNTSAISSITLSTANTGGSWSFTQYSQFALYGIRGN